MVLRIRKEEMRITRVLPANPKAIFSINYAISGTAAGTISPWPGY